MRPKISSGFCVRSSGYPASNGQGAEPDRVKPPYGALLDIGSSFSYTFRAIGSHMANERTFLAWSRTSISLLAFGFVIQRFDLFTHQIAQLSGYSISLSTHQGMIYLSFFCFGMAGISAVASGWRFLAVRRHLNWGMASYSFVPDALLVA